MVPNSLSDYPICTVATKTMDNTKMGAYLAPTIFFSIWQKYRANRNFQKCRLRFHIKVSSVSFQWERGRTAGYIRAKGDGSLVGGPMSLVAQRGVTNDLLGKVQWPRAELLPEQFRTK